MKRPLAFFTGWFSILGWWIITCSGHLLAAVTVVGLVSFWHPGFGHERWNVYVVYVAVAAFTSKCPLPDW